MGKFDGILICSDWDGTLFDGEKVPEESVNAIKYFQENGGKFTLCSGRPPCYMEKMSACVKPNTFALALNVSCLRAFPLRSGARYLLALCLVPTDLWGGLPTIFYLTDF